jgi:hypothetical protein
LGRLCLHTIAYARADADVGRVELACRHAGIPHEFHDLIRALSAAGQPPAAVDKVLHAAADRDNIDVTWVYNDVYHFMSATTAEKAFDATGFLEQLEERRKLYGLPFYYLTDADGRLSRVFVVLAGGLEGYAKSISFVDACGGQPSCCAIRLDGALPCVALNV